MIRHPIHKPLCLLFDLHAFVVKLGVSDVTAALKIHVDDECQKGKHHAYHGQELVKCQRAPDENAAVCNIGGWGCQ